MYLRIFAGSIFALLVSPFANAAPGWSPTLTVTTLWHDNVTNSDRPTDTLAAFQTITAAAAAQRHLLTRNDSLVLGAHLLVESWPRYDGLDRTALGAAVTWQHKFALGPFAPTLRAEITGDVLRARERGRSGGAGTAALVYRQRFADVMRFQLAHEWSRTDARDLAFDRTGQETAALLARQCGDAWELIFTARRRDGTVLAYSSPPRLDLIAKGKKITFSPTFDRAAPMVAYYFDARTDSLELRASRSLGPRLALTFAAEARRTTHGDASYHNRVFAAALVRPF